LTLAIATRRLGLRAGVEEWLRALEGLGVRALRIDGLASPAAEVGVVLRARGVAVVGLRVPPAEADVALQLADARGIASALRTRVVILSLSAAAHQSPHGREAATEHVARALHGAQREGMPLALRYTAGGDDLLDMQMLEWLLGDLPTLGVWLDIPALEHAHRANEGLALPALAETLGPRVRGLDIAGASDGAAGGAHPEDGGPDWSTLWEILPRDATRVLDVDPGPDGSRLREALAWLRAAEART
jgi:hypothetical protein